jgi:hypothetical protein
MICAKTTHPEEKFPKFGMLRSHSKCEYELFVEWANSLTRHPSFAIVHPNVFDLTSTSQ